jgi:hypothetical protein
MGFFGGGGGGTTPVNMVGASTGTAGTAGYVPAPAAGKNTRALFSDASFGEIPLLPKYKNTTAARYVQSWKPYGANAGATPNANIRVFHLLYVPSDGQVDVLAFRTSTAPATAYNVHLAIWQMNEDGTVGSYVIGGNGSTGTAPNTTINISVTATSVVRGYYWISLTADVNGSSGSISASPSILGQFYSLFLGATGVTQGTQVIWNYTCATSYNQTTHETFNLSAPTNPSLLIPDMGFQYV